VTGTRPCTARLAVVSAAVVAGGHFALDWYEERAPDLTSMGTSAPATPLVLILHGVNGHGDEPYMRHLAHQVTTR
jgi:predicted alpha/beta-fold hydrolase